MATPIFELPIQKPSDKPIMVPSRDGFLAALHRQLAKSALDLMPIQSLSCDLGRSASWEREPATRQNASREVITLQKGHPLPPEEDMPAFSDIAEAPGIHTSSAHSVGMMKLEIPVYSGFLGELQRQFGTIDVDKSGSMSPTELLEHVITRIEEKGNPLTPEQLKLLRDEITQRHEEIALGSRDGIHSPQWVHYKALRGTAPTYVAARGVNWELANRLARDSTLLCRIQTAFQVADTQCNGRLSAAACSEALDQLEVPNFKSQISELDLDGDGLFDYFEFINLALEIKPVEISIAYYDVSHGYSEWIPASLTSGHKFECIWHTGVLAFGKEWWYGGSIFVSDPAATPFGKPEKVEKFGFSLRTKRELEDFCSSELCSKFTKKSYDVFEHNCNHFSNDIVQFLLRGRQIPEDVRMQPAWAKHGSLVQTIRPILNNWLGGFGSESGGKADFNRIDDMTNEWRSRICTGDTVLHRKRHIDRPHVARITQLETRGDDRIATIATFRPTGAAWSDGTISRLGELWDWHLESRDVPVTELWPNLSISGVGATSVTPDRLKEGDVSKVMKRAKLQPDRLCCTLGHILEPIHTSWFSFLKPCNICGRQVTLETGLGCEQCSFQMCTTCMRLGRTLKGGGVFTDIMNRDLAEELLNHPALLRYKAQCYFARADDNDDTGLDYEELVHISSRLSAELQVNAALVYSELNCKSYMRHGEEAKKKCDKHSFELLFASTLRQALESPLETNSSSAVEHL